MSNAALETAIEAAWEARDSISPATKGEARDAIEATLTALDSGSLRVAEKRGADWHVNQWAKKAVLLSFRLTDMYEISGSNGGSNWWDKVPSKFQGWTEADWRKAGFRAVPGSIVRRSAYIGKGVVLMPSFVNIGAFVDEGSMVDGWATVGSCAQIGKNVHLSGGVGIGGVLEPMQAGPTIIEDNCFIGARSEVVEGVVDEIAAGLRVFQLLQLRDSLLVRNTFILHRRHGFIHRLSISPENVHRHRSRKLAALRPIRRLRVVVRLRPFQKTLVVAQGEPKPPRS